MRTQMITKPMISLDVLGKMVRNLSPEQLRNLPIEKLPETLPDGFYSIGTPEKNAVIDDLLIRRDSERMNRQVTDVEIFGKELADAFEVAESNSLPPLVREFALEAAALRKLVEASDAPAEDQQIQAKTAQLTELLERVQASPIVNAECTLAKLDCGDNAELRARVERCIRRLSDKVKPVTEALAQYHAVRLSLAHREMSMLRKRLKKQAATQELLQEQIDALNEDLQKQRSLWSRALGKYHNSDEYRETQEQIKQLVARQKMSEVPIDDEVLTGWLDSVVDASLNDRDLQGVRASRVLLLSMLEQYCRQQEYSALQIAKNPFTQVDPKKAIEFILASEQFILNYFARKQEQESLLFRTTAENRRDQLGGIMAGLIRELKKNLRRTG